MKTTRIRVRIRLAAAFVIGALCLLAFAPIHGNASASTLRVAASVSHATTPTCPPEANSCAPVVSFPCAAGTCTVTAGPVTQLGQGQAVYVDVSGLESNEQVGLGLCSLTSGSQVVASPTCASSLPAPEDCGDSCNPTPSPLEWQYGTGTGAGDTVLSIGTEFDPSIAGATPIVSQSEGQYHAGTGFGSFFCDNGPASPCGIEVMDLGINTGYVVADGDPPAGQSGTFVNTASNTVIIPVNWAASGSGCQSAPIESVDASYSVAQFLPAAGAATCSGTDGVAVLPTSEPSVDDASCQSTGTTHCPITDVINGTVPATFTDDPNDPATVAELKAAGGKFAYIPVAVSSTEIAFEGQAGRNGVSAITYPLSSYNLTPAQTAGIMTQAWNSPIANGFVTEDDLCSQLTGTAQCTETPSTAQQPITAYEANGQTANIAVSTESGGQPDPLSLPVLSYTGNYSSTSIKKPDENYANDTGNALLNPWPGDTGSTPTTENNLEAMFPSTGSGASFETTSWICDSPDLPFTVTLPWSGTALLTDLASGQQLLANAEQDPIGMTQNEDGSYSEQNFVSKQFTADASTGCDATSSLPTDFEPTNTIGYAPASEPLTAAHTIQGAITQNLLGFAFSAMDSSEADFFGLLPANLQNAQGSFVSPSAASITAALADEGPSPNDNGTTIPNFQNTTDAAAYPMPMVTYALISTSAQTSTDQADQLTELLTNLVNYSATGGVGSSEPLPPGYVALPKSLQQQALADITSDVIAPNGQPVGGEAAAAASLAASSAASSSASNVSNESSEAPFTFTGALGAPFGAAGLAKSSGSGSAKAASNSSGGGSDAENPIGRFIAVTLGDNRYLVPGLLLLALLCLVAGPLLYLSPSVRKPATAGTDGGDEGAGDGGDIPPPAE